MKDKLLIFQNDEKFLEKRYVIAYFSKKSWYHYLDFPIKEDAEGCLKKLRRMKPEINFGLFERIEQVTISKLSKENFK